MDTFGTINCTVQLMGIALCLTGIIGSVVLNRHSKGALYNPYFIALFVFMAISAAGNVVSVLVQGLGSGSNTVIYVAKIFAIGGGYWYMAAFTMYLISTFEAHAKFHVWRWLPIALAAAMSILLLCNVFGQYLYSVENGVYMRGELFWLTPAYEAAVLLVDFALFLVFCRKLPYHDFWAYLIYLLLPIIGIVAQTFYSAISFLDIAIVLGIVVLLLHCQAQITEELLQKQQLASEQQMEMVQLREANIISQVQPHFIYNTLSAIRGIEGNPPETKTAITEFGDYLRGNLAALNAESLIPLTKELEHVNTYVYLEQLRFGDKVNVVFDLQDTDFAIPPLTVQIIVENAIKHGITQRYEGGTVEVRTWRENGCHVLRICDNGVGFDTSEPEHSKRVGLRAVKNRLSYLAGGSMHIESTLGVGTVVTIEIPVAKPNEAQ